MLPGAHHIGRLVHFSLKVTKASRLGLTAPQSNLCYITSQIEEKANCIKKHLSILIYSIKARTPSPKQCYSLHSSIISAILRPCFTYGRSHFFQKKKKKNTANFFIITQCKYSPVSLMQGRLKAPPKESETRYV